MIRNSELHIHSVHSNQKMVDQQRTKTSDNNQPEEVFCKVEMDSLMNLKGSTKKLLHMIEEIERKTITIKPVKNAFTGDALRLPIVTFFNPTSQKTNDDKEPTAETNVLKQLEEEIAKVDKIETEEDDCSVYKKLTRKCHCLNRTEYNDLLMSFNEDTKFSTSTLGEIIKNLRILKRFLYIGGDYTKHALMFLNEGLTKSPISEKVDIVLAASHADLCNVFDDQTLPTVCISWPFRYENAGDFMTQNLAARVLYRIASIEEGRRYLNFNSKTIINLKRVLQTRENELDDDTVEFLKATINLLSPSIVTNQNASLYCKADEEAANKVINALSNFRIYMTLEEIMHNLELLNQFSCSDIGRREMWPNMITLLGLFKCLLTEYDDTKINVLITYIIRNVVKIPYNGGNMNYATYSKCYTVSDTATEPLEVKHQSNQIPIRNQKKFKRVRSDIAKPSKITAREIVKKRQSSTGTVGNKSLIFNRSINRSLAKELQRSFIVVPVEKGVQSVHFQTDKKK